MQKVVVLDSGGQYCHLIARKVRELGVYAEIRPLATPASRLRSYQGAIISGGPASVFETGSPQPDDSLFQAGLPILGICYGHHLLAHHLRGIVQPGHTREFGHAVLTVESRRSIFAGLKPRERVWMSHGDQVAVLPPGFQRLATTRDCAIAAMGDEKRRFYGLQFHPEVTHTEHGLDLLQNFLFRVCGYEGDWRPGDRVKELEVTVRRKVGDRRVLFFLSGGVDSTVAYTVTERALGPDRVHAVFVDTGFMRLGEGRQIASVFRSHQLGALEVVDARRQFFQALRGVTDPEAKRKIIGRLFVDVQDQILAGRRYRSKDWMLGQGTIYPDTIESGGTQHAAVIKTHHNRVDRIQQLIAEKRVLEPLSHFYKDEVRVLGRALGLPDSVIRRHPFPGPGLAIRCLCSGSELRPELDLDISIESEAAGYHAFLLPLRSVGVQGDFRTYAKLTVLHGAPVRHDLLEKLATSLTNQFRQTNRVAVALSPPSIDPLEWRVHRATLTPRRIRLLQKVDEIVTRFLREQFLYDLIWQCPVVLLPLGLNGGETVAIRPISSVDGMTAEVVHIPLSQLKRLTAELAAVPGIDAVLYDVSHKPPSTIEWE
jgi:GMP synthase (glutamine-hydrolysing)